ncbi:unnamed protein product [Cylindrotheca closterium]|uniref:Uncharacterized protein n=1 Tax=Cylindrotheca closterium TaxID=2856 RepID=A0AAD2FSR9_9STRA|nr:unnamed protein product [Cylindrotheca closterium]
MSNSSYINALVRSLYDESQEHNDSTLSIKAHRASRVIIKKDNKKVTKILAGRQAAVKSHVFVTEMAKILAAKQQKVPIKDNVVVKNSKHAKRMAAFHRKQEEDAQQTMPMANNIAFVGPTKAEVNEWFHDKKKRNKRKLNIFIKRSRHGTSSPLTKPPPP